MWESFLYRSQTSLKLKKTIILSEKIAVFKYLVGTYNYIFLIYFSLTGPILKVYILNTITTTNIILVQGNL